MKETFLDPTPAIKSGRIYQPQYLLRSTLDTKLSTISTYLQQVSCTEEFSFDRTIGKRGVPTLDNRALTPWAG